MNKRLFLTWLAVLTTWLGVSSIVWAAPQAKILRIDPRAAMQDGAPVLTLVVDLVQNKRLTSVISRCGTGNYGCQADILERPKALYTPFPFPEKNAHLLVRVDGSDQPATFVSKARWGKSLRNKGVGTAWLILVDAAGTMGRRLDDAKNIASAFVKTMGPNDIVNVMAFNGAGVAMDSKWLSARSKNSALNFIQRIPSYGRWGRARPLANIIKSGVKDGFEALGNAGSKVQVPLHQALVVLSDGSAGADPLSNAAGAMELQKHLTRGRFGDNTAMPKTPLPVISVWFPRKQVEEFGQNSEQFMKNIANPEIGGFYTIVDSGQGSVSRASRIVRAVRDRFNHMHIIKYRVSCIAPKVQQTFQLVFQNVKPPITPDGSFKDVPVGIDPSTWPLDINVDYTVMMAKKHPVHPGGTFKVYGNFCWGGDKSRAEVYFLPKNQAAPPTVQGGDIATAKRAQQQLIAMNMKGKVVQTSGGAVEFEAPDSAKILVKQGGKMVTRMVIYDNKAHRASPADAAHILTLPAETKPFPFLLVGGGIIILLIVVLLIIAIVRGGGGGGGKRRGRSGGAPPPAPVIAGGPQAQPYAGAPQAQPYGAPAAPAPVPAPAPAAASAAPGGDFMYGGGAPGKYGLTGAMPQQPEPPPNPYGASSGGGGQAVLTGQLGTFPIPAGGRLLIGRDPAQCQVVLQDNIVSGVHASVTFDGRQVMVQDEGSNNGTYLNNARIQPRVPTPVAPGSSLRFGHSDFVVRLS